MPVPAGVCAILMFIKPGFAGNHVFVQGTFILILYLVYDMLFYRA